MCLRYLFEASVKILRTLKLYNRRAIWMFDRILGHCIDVHLHRFIFFFPLYKIESSGGTLNWGITSIRFSCPKSILFSSLMFVGEDSVIRAGCSLLFRKQVEEGMENKPESRSVQWSLFELLPTSACPGFT